MRGIIETDRPLTVETVKQLTSVFKAFDSGKMPLLVLGAGMHFIPAPPARKRIRLAQSNRSTHN